MKNRLVGLLIVAGAALFAAAAVADDFDNPKAKVPEQAKPQRRSGGEGIPPLPLPATPLRRSERKREPAPPALVGMITFSQAGAPGGKAFQTTQIDIERLINFANNKLNIRYRYVPTALDSFSWDPTELPLLYLTGWTPLPNMPVEKIQRYLYDGGTLILHSQCGRKEFSDSARELIAKVFPDRQLARLDTDSPLFHAYYQVSKMRVYEDDKPPVTQPYPELWAVNLGCRPAIIFSPIDLNCGWDVASNPIIGGKLYHQDDATELGVNIITSVLADFQYARAWGVQKGYPEQAKDTRDQLVIAQVRHSGDWDPTPNALPNLMKYIQRNTTLNVQFKREEVELASIDAFKHPVLYMTGLREFTFSDAEVARLHNYLTSGGVLVADSAAGQAAFHKAFTEQMKRVLPKSELKAIDLGSPIYQMPYKIQAVNYTDMVKQQNPTLNAPTLQGITIDGQLAVIYSPLSLGCGWEQLGFAYNRGYSDADALRLGVNIFAHVLTH